MLVIKFAGAVATNARRNPQIVTRGLEKKALRRDMFLSRGRFFPTQNTDW
jgi:hypothetical protein